MLSIPCIVHYLLDACTRSSNSDAGVDTSDKPARPLALGVQQFSHFDATVFTVRCCKHSCADLRRHELRMVLMHRRLMPMHSCSISEIPSHRHGEAAF